MDGTRRSQSSTPHSLDSEDSIMFVHTVHTGRSEQMSADTIRASERDRDEDPPELVRCDTADGLRSLVPTLKNALEPMSEAKLQHQISGSYGNKVTISVARDGGPVERLKISPLDTAQAQEQCLRNVFNIPDNIKIVLRDSDGCAIPLGPGLVDVDPDEQTGIRHFSLQVGHADIRDMEPPVRSGRKMTMRSLSQQTLSHEGRHSSDQIGFREEEPAKPIGLGKNVSASLAVPGTVPWGEQSSFGGTMFMKSQAIQSETDFWLQFVTEGWGPMPAQRSLRRPNTREKADQERTVSGSLPPATPSASVISDDREVLCDIDTSPQNIEFLFNQWSKGRETLSLETLQEHLKVSFQFEIGMLRLEDAMEKVSERFGVDRGGYSKKEGLTRVVFASFWQRLALGTCCYENGEFRCLHTKTTINTVEYTSHHEPKKKVAIKEDEFLFGGHARGRRETKDTKAKMRWGWVEGPDRSLLVKIGVKFFLHPLAIEDMINAAREGSTKIDRYRHQYFVSLEVYTVYAPERLARIHERRKTMDNSTTRMHHATPDKPVKLHIKRSTMSLVATGSPPTHTNATAARDWLITIINNAEHKYDPLECFTTDKESAQVILESIYDDVQNGKRVREYQADFLLFSIIDKAAEEMTPIYNAYGHRLRYLQRQFENGELSQNKQSVEEVSQVRLELQELRQWTSQMKGIIRHLQSDCQQDPQQQQKNGGIARLWSFGQDERSEGNGGKTMFLFLRHTSDYLDQAAERLAVLDDLAMRFLQSTDRQQSDLMNETLFVLTVATVVMSPAQFLAAVFGMNFKHGMNILEAQNGYVMFWVLSGSLVLLTLLLAITCIYCRKRSWKNIGRRCGCCRQKTSQKDKGGQISQLAGTTTISN